MNGLALCSGVAGLELGVRLAVGPGYRTVGHVERDAYAAAVLVARMEEQTLDPAPVWDDVTTFDGAAWRGCVDIVTAGFSCQPWSSAGLGLGVEDERWIWPGIARAIRDVGPDLVFLENVPPLVVRGGLNIVLGDLAEFGFDAEWCVLSAKAAGATHLRKRVFIMAHTDSARRLRIGREPGHDRDARNDLDRSGSPAMADASGRLFPPGPDDLDGWASVLAEDPSLEPSVLRDADGLASRLDRVRCAGNGVVPLMAAVAFRCLAERAGITGPAMSVSA